MCASLLSAYAHKYIGKDRQPHMHNNSTRDKGVSERTELTLCNNNIYRLKLISFVEAISILLFYWGCGQVFFPLKF